MRARVRLLLALPLVVGLPGAAFLAGRPHPLPRADLVFVLPKEPGTLDPADATSVAEAWILWSLFEGLTRFDPVTLKPVPAAAQSLVPDAEGKVWTATLRPGLRWSDGEPLTASDFAFGLGRILDPATGSPHRVLFSALESVTARNDRTLVLRLAEPLPYLPALLAHFAAVPLRRDVLERHGRRWTEPGRLVCNGPYRLALRRVRDRIRLTRNPFYRGADGVALATVDALAVDSRTTALNLYLTGDVDWVNAIPADTVPDLADRPDLRLAPVLATNFLRFNTARPPLDDARLRRALSLAIDREALCRYVLRRGDRPASSLVPPSLPGYVPPTVVRRDLAAARRLLAETGHRRGVGLRELELLHAADAASSAVADALASSLRAELGVRLRPVAQEHRVFLDSQRRGLYDLCLAVWYGDYPDPSTFLECFLSSSPNNRTGWSDPEYDRLVFSARGELDPARRFALLRAAEERLLESAPIAPLSFRAQPNLVSERLSGFTQNLLDFHPLERLGWRGSERR